MAAHARLSPSASERWLNCHISVWLIERLIAEGKIDPNESSVAADNGTAAHQVRADSLLLGTDAHDWIGSKLTINGAEYHCTEKVADRLQPGIDWVRQQGGEMHVEHRVDLTRWMPGQFGTLDTGIILREQRKAIIDDLKFGNIDVQPTAPQLRIYGLGYVDNFDLYDVVDTIDFVIDQPFSGGLKPWSCSLDELLRFGEAVVKPAVAAINGPNPQYKATKKGCYWCPVKDTEEGCPAYTQFNVDLFGAAFEDLEAPEPAFPVLEALSPERRFYIVRHMDVAKKWLDDLADRSQQAAAAGKPDPGSKLIDGKPGDRFFTDSAKAAALLTQALGPAAYTQPEPKLIGPSPAKDLLKPGRKKPGNPEVWKQLEALIDRPVGKPLLVPEDDPRPARTSLASKFVPLLA